MAKYLNGVRLGLEVVGEVVSERASKARASKARGDEKLAKRAGRVIDAGLESLGASEEDAGFSPGEHAWLLQGAMAWARGCDAAALDAGQGAVVGGIEWGLWMAKRAGLEVERGEVAAHLQHAFGG